MFCIKNIIVVVNFLTIVKYTNSFGDFAADIDILRAEAIIRNTTNKLFASLKLQRENRRLSRYLIINKHFASLTLKDHDTLNKIFNISIVNNVSNNGSRIFMSVINELLNERHNEIDENEINNNLIPEKCGKHLVDFIEIFLRGIKEAKELDTKNTHLEINENILRFIKESNHTTTDRQYFENETISDNLEFWKPSGRRIYKGERTKIKHFPFMASIQIFNVFQCAGSIIKSDLIITASSCLQLAWNNRFYRENPAFLSVRVGSSFYSGGGEVIPVLEVYFHPGYNPKNLRNNIAIVRLIRKIKFRWRSRRRVRKIDIDRHDSNLPYNTPGITILGWGARGPSNVIRDPWQNILSYALLYVYGLKDCQDVYSKEYVTNKHFCAGFMSKGGGACNRDVGGPGIDEDKLMGIVSFGSPVCGAADAPTVFTKVGYYADWIDSIMEQEVPYSKKKTTLRPSKAPYKLLLKDEPTSTTFKILPLSEEKTSAPINYDENVLGMLDEDLFNEFLKTTFVGKESEYQDIFEDAKESVVSRESFAGIDFHSDEPQQVTSPDVHFEVDTATQLANFEVDSEETAPELDYSDKIDEDKIISKNDLQIIKDTLPKSKKKESKTAQFDFEEIKIPTIGNTNNESVLTLLYLSDENKDKDYETLGENETGMSISPKPFQDLTRSKGMSKNLYETVLEKELYEILTEVIAEEMQNNKTSL